MKCENHAWKVIGNPKCVPDGGPVDPPVEPCPKFIKVKNGWMECKQTGKGTFQIFPKSNHILRLNSEGFLKSEFWVRSKVDDLAPKWSIRLRVDGLQKCMADKSGRSTKVDCLRKSTVPKSQGHTFGPFTLTLSDNSLRHFDSSKRSSFFSRMTIHFDS